MIKNAKRGDRVVVYSRDDVEFRGAVDRVESDHVLVVVPDGIEAPEYRRVQTRDCRRLVKRRRDPDEDEELQGPGSGESTA